MNMQALMREAQKMQKELQNTQKELENTIYEGSSSLVYIKMNGKKYIGGDYEYNYCWMW